jgi:chromosome segregation ATPase
MESESRQSWLLIAIAGLSVVLGAIALVVAFDAKSSSDDAAEQSSVDQVSSKLSRLTVELGVDEESLEGEEKTMRGEETKAARGSRAAESSLSDRLAKVERQTKALEESEQENAALAKRVKSLEDEVGTIDSRIAALNQRVTKLSKRVNSNAQTSGGQTTP